MTRHGLTVAERFWPRVDQRQPDECWAWTGPKDKQGYGGFSVAAGKRYGAHRLAYELAVGPIPVGMEVDHLCHVRACVNPSHLRVVTHRQNTQNRSGAQRNSRSGVRGVCWHKRSGKWHAYVAGSTVGYFDSLDEAAQTVAEARRERFTHSDMDRRAS